MTRILNHLSKRRCLILILSLSLIFLAHTCLAQSSEAVLRLQLPEGYSNPKRISVLLEILFLLTVLSVAPAIMLTVTSFTRIVIVFAFLRQAMGIQQMPPNQVLVSLAIFMTFVIMYPVGKAINKNAIQPYLNEEISFKDALHEAEKPLRKFLFRNTREKDISLFFSITHMQPPRTKEDVPTYILIPAFMVSEMKTAFEIGFLIYIPFLIIDMVVSSILLSMGMMMLPPVMISLPFKILLFVLVNGWSLLVGSLISSFK